MRKFFVTLLLLLIIGGAAFFFGWAQLAVPPGSWGVMRSKTHGLEKELLREGEFRWVWYRLIPGNVEILVFSPVRVSRTVSWQGELPSGKVYAALAGVSADFSWDLGGDLSFGIKPSSLPALVEKRNIGTQGELESFAGELAEEIASFAQRRLLALAEGGGNAGDSPFPPGYLADFPPELEAEIYRFFPDIEDLSCRVRPGRVPDFALYRSVRQLYEDYLQKQREFLSSGLGQAAGLRLSSQMRFDELEKYGDLLSRYPILLQYLALEKGSVLEKDLVFGD